MVRLALVDVALKHAPFEEGLILLRAIGRLGQDTRAGVARADQVRQPGTIMGVCGAGVPGPD